MLDVYLVACPNPLKSFPAKCDGLRFW
jgi:hypothetical protein